MNFKFTKKHIIIAVILVTIGVVLMFLGGCNNSGNESENTTEVIVTSTATDGTTGDATEEETTENLTTEEATTQSATDATEEVTTESATDATEIGRDEDPLTTTEAIIEEVIEITTQAQTTEAPATTEATNTSERVWVEPVYEQVWVVDREAQTVELPIYEERGKTVCNGCGADVTGDPNGHAKSQLLAGVKGCGGWHSEVEYVIVGYDTIVEPEEGHWETVCVQEGYWKEVE